MSIVTRLDVSIGPVQGYVAHSRRTRDLWASSYLLSVLAGHAMQGARSAGGEIVVPAVDSDSLYRWIAGHREGTVPQLGSLPNHFVVEVDGDPITVAQAAREGFDAGWRQLCAVVWDRYVGPIASAGGGTQDIWDRQVHGFWEFTWTAGELDQGSELLERRKHWRSARPPEEAGDKCALLPDLQELSGYIRARGRRDRERQDNFWRSLSRGGSLSELELRANERLSAVGLVKRLFPLVSEPALGWRVDRRHWPSTIEFAALSAADIQSEPIADPAPPFYSLLLADGDRLGRLVSKLGGQTVGEALSHFTAQAPDIVTEHDGVTVYAGGDDVLAMLPMDRAIQCAGELAKSYRAAFDGRDEATLSTAVILAQGRVPLRSVIEESHHLLDDIAKERNGRDSLAVAVLKGSGKHCQWVSTWDRRFPGSGKVSALDSLDELVRQFRTASTDPGTSGSLVYRLRDTLARLSGWQRWQPGDWGELPSRLDARTLLLADVTRSLSATGSGSQSDAVQLVDVMMRMLGPARSADATGPAGRVEVGIDGLLLARFLADPADEG